ACSIRVATATSSASRPRRRSSSAWRRSRSESFRANDFRKGTAQRWPKSSTRIRSDSPNTSRLWVVVTMEKRSHDRICSGLYSIRDDARIEWLADFLSKHRAEKILLICKSQRKVAAIEAALQEKRATKSALFHEGLQLVQRDRNAAWFAEPGGAQILLCSEI